MKKEIQLSQKKRVWEIDAVRGFLILCLLLFHLNFTLDAFFVQGGYRNIDVEAFVKIADPLGLTWKEINGSYKWCFLGKFFNPVNYSGVNLFFVISGISCIFSRNNLNRGVKMLVGAFIVSGFTKLLAVWTGDKTQFIRFGALHCYAYCHLIYYFLLEKRKSRTLLLVCVPIFLIGYYLRYNPVYSNISLLHPFGLYEKGTVSRDYWPIFPMLGWMLIGVVLGRCFYSEKKSLCNNTTIIKITRPLQWLGKHSGSIYLIHIFVYTGVFCGMGYLFGLL